MVFNTQFFWKFLILVIKKGENLRILIFKKKLKELVLGSKIKMCQDKAGQKNRQVWSCDQSQRCSYRRV